LVITFYKHKHLYIITVNKIKDNEMKWIGHVACMADMRNAYTMLVEKFET
jgi:hypothetical protein